MAFCGWSRRYLESAALEKTKQNWDRFWLKEGQ